MNSSSRKNISGSASFRRIRPSTRRLIYGAAALIAAGCAEAKREFDFAWREMREPRRSAKQNLTLVLESTDPNGRRTAAAQLVDSGACSSDETVRVFCAVALLDADAQTRCVAIRGLTRSGDPRATKTLLQILRFREYPQTEVRPPNDLVRWDATLGLARLSEQGKVPQDQAAKVAETLLNGLRSDPDRHCRIAAATGLGAYRDPPVVRALIDALSDPDFAVVYSCESSLVRLTGVTQKCSRTAWDAWHEQNRNALFANAGNIPESRRPAYTNEFERINYNVVQFMRWMWPGAKSK